MSLFIDASIDDMVVYWYLGIVLLGFVINAIVKKIKYSDTSRISLMFEKKEILGNLENYTFNFNDDIDELGTDLSSSVSVIHKMILFILSFLIIFLPLYEFIEALRPQEFYVWSSCMLSYIP